MNQSGIFVKKLTSHYSLVTNHLIIVHDDLDIPLGKFHIQFDVGPRLHNGLESIEQHLNTKDFWRIRIGIDSRPPQKLYLAHGHGIDNKRIDGESYVLQDFLPEEKKLLHNEIFPELFFRFKIFLKNQFSLSL